MKKVTKASIFGERPMRLFSAMKTRCGYNLGKSPLHYAESYIHQDWLDSPETFYKFVVQVDNYDSLDDKGRLFHIEKDLFCFNSKLSGYYPETICFLPRALNQALQLEHEGQRSANKGLPVGVTYEKGRYKAQISVNGKPKYLGTGTVEECAELYRKAKVSRLEELIEIWKPVLPDKVVKQLHLFVSHLKAF